MRESMPTEKFYKIKSEGNLPSKKTACQYLENQNIVAPYTSYVVKFS